MFRILAWGAFSLGLVPFVSAPILRSAARAFEGLEVGVLMGSFAAVLILFIIPITLLGHDFPFRHPPESGQSGVVRQNSGHHLWCVDAGIVHWDFPAGAGDHPDHRHSQHLSCASAWYCWRWPWWGWRGMAAARCLFQHAWMPVVLIGLAIAMADSPLKSSANQVFEAESAYNYIQVQQAGNLTLLRLNDGEGVHSIYSPDTLDYGGPWEQFLVGPYFYENAEPQQVMRMAIVGLAAGTTARQATAVYGPIPIDGFELDPKIVEVGAKYFGEDLDNLTVHIGDGRWNLEQSPLSIRHHRCGRLSPSVYSATHDHAGVLQHLRRASYRARRAGNQRGQRPRGSTPDQRAGDNDGLGVSERARDGHTRNAQHNDLRHDAADLRRQLCVPI